MKKKKNGSKKSKGGFFWSAIYKFSFNFFTFKKLKFLLKKEAFLKATEILMCSCFGTPVKEKGKKIFKA